MQRRDVMREAPETVDLDRFRMGECCGQPVGRGLRTFVRHPMQQFGSY
ncbi:hypothetical protein [Skermanella pratensis]|nr:hypothetical protein [Skermanella pratensis]